MVIKKEQLYKLSEYLYLSILGVFLIVITYNNVTTFVGFPPYVEKFFLLLFIISGTTRLVLMWLVKPQERKKLSKFILCSLIPAAVWMLVYRNDGFLFLIFLAVLSVTSVGCNYQKVLKTFVIAEGLIFITAVFSAFANVIPNYVYYSQYRLRSSWGIIYPTDLASFFLFLCITAWIAWKKIPDWFFLLPGICALFVSYVIAASNTSTICCILFIFFILLHTLLRYVNVSFLEKTVKFISSISFPTFGGIVIALFWLYKQESGLADRINVLTHSRLSNAVKAYDLYGIKFFGTPLPQVGNGGGTGVNVGYNFVDSTYLLILLRYGVVALIVITILWMLMTRHAGIMGDYRLLLSLVLISFHSISEHHFTEVNYNIFLILPFSVLYSKQTEDEEKKAAFFASEMNKYGFAAFATFISIGLIFFLIGPGFLSWFCTICDITGLNFPYYRIQRVYFVIVFAFICLLFVGIYFIYRGYLSMIFRSQLGTKAKKVFFVSSFCIMCILFGSKIMLHREYQQWSNQLDADRKAVEAVQEAEKCDLYVMVVPEFYKKEFTGVRSAFLPLDDYSRLRNVAVILDSDVDSNVLTSRGFLYTEISESHAIYTNSETAAAKLHDAGFHLTGFYSKNKAINMFPLRETYGAGGDDNLAVIVTDKNPVRTGSGLTLFNNNYLVNLVLSFDSALNEEKWNTLDPEAPVCKFLISSNNNAEIVTEKTFVRKQFINRDKYSADFSVRIPTANNVEFQILPLTENVNFLLHDLHYQKKPSYDVHMVFDESWHNVHESYYDLEGKPFTLDAGYQSRDIGYDQWNHINYYRYYDTNAQPVIGDNGFAEVQREYNQDHQLLKESYYDVNSLPVIRSGGYASVAYERDSKGNVLVYRYYGVDNEPVMISSGYAILTRKYNNANKIIRESYFDDKGIPVLCKAGYSSLANTYTSDGQLSLTSFWNLDGSILSRGSFYLHNYFQLLKDKKYTVFISSKDDASGSLTVTLLEDMKKLGLESDLMNKKKYSFCAVISPEGIFEQLSENQEISHSDLIGDSNYVISSAGYSVGNNSSIIINGIEYSKDVRGLNIVVYNPETRTVIDSFGIDTYSRDMKVTR